MGKLSGWNPGILPKSGSLLQSFPSLASTLGTVGEVELAREFFQRAISLSPNNLDMLSSYLGLLTYSTQCTAAFYKTQAQHYGECVRVKATPFEYGPNDRLSRAGRPLRVGIVSADLRDHVVGYFLENIAAKLDPLSIKLIAYSGSPLEDALTARLKLSFFEWHSLVTLDDAQAAKKINDDRIDILIDLAGHTAQNRLPVFAFKPAPVQVSWLGYFASTGVSTIDYVLTDPASWSADHDQAFTEKAWLLPDSRLCFTPPATRLLPAPPPALQKGYVTFGCFQNIAKINVEVIKLWSQIFVAIPTARLRVQCKQLICPVTQANFSALLERNDIPADRVSLLGPTSRDEYLNTYAEVDMVLDTFPFPGGTTTCESLWMGVPTITLNGTSMIGRQGATLLKNAGLEEWIAATPKAYVELAIKYAAAPQLLATLRANMRDNVAGSPIFDAKRFADNLTIALQAIWDKQS